MEPGRLVCLIPLEEPVGDDAAPPRSERTPEARPRPGLLSANVDQATAVDDVAPDGRNDHSTVGAVPKNPKGVGRSGVVSRAKSERVLLGELSLQLVSDLTEGLLGEGRASAHR